MDTDESVLESEEYNDEEKLSESYEINNYHDSYDLSGSTFSGNISFSVDSEKRFINQSEIPLPNVGSWYDYKPEISLLVHKAVNEGVLFLGGGLDQLDQLARTIAWNIKYNTRAKSEHNGLQKIFEWKGRGDGDNVTAIIEEECKEGIVILPFLMPEDIHFNYQSLVDLSGEHRIIIITTPINEENWQQQLNNSNFSIETPSYYHLFSSYQRRDFVSKKIAQLKNDESLDGSISLENDALFEICDDIGSFNTIDEYVEKVFKIGLSRRVSLTEAQSIAEDFKNKLTQLVIWYENLEPRSQFLCLLSCIYKSVTVEQLLELSEKIILDFWRPMYGEIPVFDYRDLKTLNKYFRVQNYGPNRERIEAVNFSIPDRILEYAWENQRRYLISILPFCSATIEASVRRSARFNYMLYGSRSYKESIWQDTSYFMSFIGNKKIRSVERYLLETAETDSYRARKVVARTLAKLYIGPSRYAILRLLRNWNKEEKEYLQTTIILTISEVFRNVSTDDLPIELLEIFEDILSWPSSKKVHDYIEKYFLPDFYLFHFLKAHTYTNALVSQSSIPDDVISYAISEGQSYFYKELRSYLYEQLNISRQAEDRDKNTITNRLKYLSVSLGVLQHIDYSKNRVLTVHEAFELISEILDKEYHSLVRRSALKALVRLSSTYPEVVNDNFQNLIQSLTNEEREEIAEHLYFIYVEERRARQDAEAVLEIVEGKSFPVWIYTERPKMPIEETISQWLEGAKTVPSTSLAYKADSLIHNLFDIYEQQAIEAFKEAREARRKALLEEQPIETIRLDKSSEGISWYSQMISIPLGTRRYPGTREAIKGILPEALKQTLDVQDQMVERRKKRGDNQDLPLALEATLQWERRKSAVILAIGFVTIALLAMLAT